MTLRIKTTPRDLQDKTRRPRNDARAALHRYTPANMISKPQRTVKRDAIMTGRCLPTLHIEISPPSIDMRSQASAKIPVPHSTMLLVVQVTTDIEPTEIPEETWRENSHSLTSMTPPADAATAVSPPENEHETRCITLPLPRMHTCTQNVITM
jgi:hypothetical protein